MIFELTLALGLAAVPQQDPMSLSLHDAVERAHRSNPALLAERAAARAQAQKPLEASRAFLPDLRFGVTGNTNLALGTSLCNIYLFDGRVADKPELV